MVTTHESCAVLIFQNNNDLKKIFEQALLGTVSKSFSLIGGISYAEQI